MKKIIKYIIPYLKKTVSYLEHKTSAYESKEPITSLAPKVIKEEKELKRIRPYLNSLNNALSTDEINNIAITGGYGSGKSTILKTFQYHYPSYHYLNISLASFKDNKEKNDGDPQGDFERRLEVSILQQMFYHVKPSIIPDSRFKRIINLRKRNLFLQAFAFLVWLMSTYILFRFQLIDKLNPKTWTLGYSFDWTTFILIVIFSTGIGVFIKSLIRLFSNSKINKFNIKGELELAESTDKSVFNQHLEEILYFFERTKYNVVIIEDVDRFESTDIFTKLREMNILVNKSETINREIKFVYAIKDDMFKHANERVKFFEFIIPIIPFINPSNANEQLTSLIESANLQGVLSKEFTSDVVTFIDDIDMRLLINIFQEYQLYRENLSVDLDQDQLFAMIVYKNMFPDDFGELPKRKGELYKIISSKEKYIEPMKKSALDEISVIDERVEKIESEAGRSIKELRAVYINMLTSKLDGYYAFYVNNKNVSSGEILDDIYFNQLKISNNVFYTKVINYNGHYYTYHQNQGSKTAFSDIEREVFPSLKYNEREQLLKSKISGVANNLKKEKEQLKSRISELESLSLKEIFEHVNVDDHLGGYKDNYLIRSLLVNGYLNENYNDYISLFHEINLSKADFTFERMVKSGSSLPLDYQLDKVDNLLKRLPIKYFKREPILNYNLFSCLIDNRVRYADKFTEHLNQISQDKEKCFQFILGYIDTDPHNVNVFIEHLVNVKKSLWVYLNEKSGLSDSKVHEFLQLIFEHGLLKDILLLEGQDDLVQFMEGLPDFFNFSSGLKNDKVLRSFLIERKLKIKNIDSENQVHSSLFEYIYENNGYAITPQTITAHVRYYKPEIEPNKLKQANYTTLIDTKLSHLNNYISENLSHYVENVLLKLPDNNEETEDTLLSILNNNKVGDELKGKLLGSQITYISLIDKVDDLATRELVIQNKKMSPTWANIFAYYDGLEEPAINDILADYLNEEIIFSSLINGKLNHAQQKDEEYIDHFSTQLIYCDKLDFEAYTSLLQCIPNVYTALDYTKINKEKAAWMIQTEFLSLSSENFNGLKEHYPGLQIDLITKHVELFETKFKEYELSDNDWALVLASRSLRNDKKIALIKEFDDGLITRNAAIAKMVCELIPSDQYIHFRFEAVDAMIRSSASVDRRLALLNLHFEHIGDDQVRLLTELLGEDYARIFKLQNKPTFQNDPLHLSFIEQLKVRDLISSYDFIEKTNEIKVVAKYNDA